MLSEYDLVSPYEVDRDGNYVSPAVTHGRRRREAARRGGSSLHLRLTGFRRDFHLELEAARQLVAPGFAVHTLGKGGARSVRPLPPEDFCFYQGSLRAHENSSVALSTCEGLVSTGRSGPCGEAAGRVGAAPAASTEAVGMARPWGQWGPPRLPALRPWGR